MKNVKLELHFAATAALCLAGAASADVVTWNVNEAIPLTTEGMYFNVETQTTGLTAAGTPGWDLNPYGGTGLAFYWSGSGAAGVRLNTVAGGTTSGTTLSSLPQGFSIGAQLTGGASGASFGSSSPSFTTTSQGKWTFNAINYFGFRFTNAAGQIRYGWGAMSVGATATTRTLLSVSYETSGASIAVGDTGGPPPAYDPCAATNPTVANGANTKPYRADAANLAVSCGTIFGANYYKFTPVDSGSYTFKSCVSNAAVLLAVRSGCEGSASELACGTPACGGSGSAATLSLTAGVPVYLVVGGSSSSSGLTSSVSVDVEAPPIPACVNATVAAYGDNAFDTGVGNNGPQVVQSNLAGTTSVTFQKSLWYAFTPTATGQFAFKTCGANGDTLLAIGTACPGGGARFNCIAYNDDAPLCSSGGTDNFASFIDATNNGATGPYAGFPLTQDLVAGTTYYICVGQYSTTATTTVIGSLNISGPEGSACAGDFNNDGIRDGADLGSLLASFGTDAGGDMNGDGITDGSDLGAFLAVFGTTCP